ncbi:PREDICTED: adenylate cyclase type 10-like [Colobus angolensis palliatus]|uniref:adenylate cyclase type 10-like n=1 Tax=Colobus angolensis palliatus TaxID=336983 RepID=UPI0005F4F809|nr:PREDICTED: adenylate cyclase type 10-like [Colobus angolensis palliatus]
MVTGRRHAKPPLWPVESRLAALLPDLLVFRKPRGSEPELATAQEVLLGVHVTGFTALMDRFSLTCKSERDMDKLAHIFSYYISDIVECLSAGRISQVIVGDERQQHLLVIGWDVDDVRLAQHLAQANEIVLSRNCWMLCEQYMFEVEIMREDEAVKLRDMQIIDPFDFDEHFDKCLDYLPHYRTSAETLRTAVELDPHSELDQKLRKLIMKNLLKKIDEGQPVEYVSEFRTVTLVLVSLEFHKTAWILHLCHLIQESALYISTVIEKGGGQLSQIFMFEKVSTRELDPSALKGCMFLCVFGLPGDKKPDECAHALESSFSIFSFCWENPAKTKMFGKRHLARKRNKNRPLLDREKELEAFQMAQQRCLHQKKGQAVLYEGGKGYGKSQLLAEINFLTQKEGHSYLHRCFGNPLYCEVLRQDLLSKDMLLFHDLQKEEEENSKWETLSANAMKSIMYSIFPANSEEDQELYVCTVKDDVNLDTVLLPPFLKKIAVSQLDQLSPEEQLLVKYAAIIGHSFHIDLLQHLLPGWDKNKLLQVLRALVDIHVLCWPDKSQELPVEPILVPSSIDIIDETKEKKTKLEQRKSS